MTKRKLRLYDPRTRQKALSGLRISGETLILIDACNQWLLEQLWANKELRPVDWNGKLTRDEAIRVILHHFITGYGVPLSTQKEKGSCEDSDTPA